MILITRREADYMRENKMGRFVHVSSKTHKSRGKVYYLTENPKALEMLNDYKKSITVAVE